MEDDGIGVDGAAHLDGVPEGRDGLLVEVVVGTRQVDQVEGVADDAADPGLGAPLLETFEVGRIVVGRPPGARALREDLDGVAAHRLDPVDRGVDAAG